MEGVSATDMRTVVFRDSIAFSSVEMVKTELDNPPFQNPMLQVSDISKETGGSTVLQTLAQLQASE